jgi:hypothetical protein
MAEGCATTVVKLGAKRAISDAQFASSDAGVTSRTGWR